jgi:hypothetical protein
MMEYLRLYLLLKWLRYYGYMVSEDYHICVGRGMVASSRISVDILQLDTIGFQICIQLVTNLPMLNCLSQFA